MTGVGDLSQHYLGWCFYRNSKWMFPIGMMDTLPYPYVSSIVFTDSMPIFAVFFKLLSPFLPQTFQYFGIWGIMCYMLQGALGALLCLKYAKNMWQAVAASPLFVLSCVLIARMFHHTALGAQWLILLALLPFVYHEELSRRKRSPLIFWGITGILCAGTHQYFIAICGILCLGYTLYSLLHTKLNRVSIALVLLNLISFLLGAVVFDALLGAFTISMGSAVADSLGSLSFNLNGFWNPLGYSVLFSDLPLYTSIQNEGRAYLGLGVFVLLGAGVISFLALYLKARLENKELSTFTDYGYAHWKSILPITVTVLICFAAATLPWITYGDTLLLDVKLPKLVETILNVFRANGRFAWPVIYMIILASVVLLMRKSQKWLALIVLICCTSLQLYDYSNEIQTKNRIYNRRQVFNNMENAEAWNALAADEKLEHVIAGTTNTSFSFRLSNIAQQNKWTLSDFWFARNVAPTWGTWKASLSKPEDNMLFVFTFVDIEDVLNAGLPYIYELEDGLFAAMMHPGPESLRRVSANELRNYSFSYDYSFVRNSTYISNGEDKDGIRYLYPGGSSYGPYLILDEGAYEITVTGDNLDIINIECESDYVHYELYDMQMSATEINLKVILPNRTSDFDIQLNNSANETAEISGISMKAIPLESVEYSSSRTFSYSARTDYLDGGEVIGGERHVHPGGSSFGPYWNLPAGAYQITMEGKNLDLAEADCISEYAKKDHALLDYRATSTELSYKIFSEEPIIDFEARLFNNSNQDVVLTTLNVNSIKPEDIQYKYLYDYSFKQNADNLDNGEDINNVRYIYPGGRSYGPYTHLDADTYTVVITGTELNLAEFDCIKDYGSTPIDLHEVQVTPTEISYQIILGDSASDLEIRLFNNSEETISIESITVFSEL